MVRIYQCTYCGHDIEPGTGSLYVRKDGAVLRFCGTKCNKNMLKLGRDPRKLKWTTKYERKIKSK